MPVLSKSDWYDETSLLHPLAVGGATLLVVWGESRFDESSFDNLAELRSSCSMDEAHFDTVSQPNISELLSYT